MTDTQTLEFAERREFLITLSLTLASLEMDALADVADTVLSMTVDGLGLAAGALFRVEPPAGPQAPAMLNRLAAVNADVPAAWPLASACPVVVDDMQPLVLAPGDAEFASARPPFVGETSAFAAVPVISRGEAIGVMLAIRETGTDGQGFSDADVEWFRMAAGIAAIAIVNAQAREDERVLRDGLKSVLADIQAQQEINRMQAERIHELSVPIIDVWDGVLALPLIGTMDTERAGRMTQELLAEVSATHANFVVLDLTGVSMIDTETIHHLLKLTRAVRMIGADCLLAGISPNIARGLVGLDVPFDSLRAYPDLKSALGAVFRQMGLVVRRMATR